VSTNSTIEVKVQSNFEDAEAVALTGGTSKKMVRVSACQAT
jgi:hypothetical protein